MVLCIEFYKIPRNGHFVIIEIWVRCLDVFNWNVSSGHDKQDRIIYDIIKCTRGDKHVVRYIVIIALAINDEVISVY